MKEIFKDRQNFTNSYPRLTPPHSVPALGVLNERWILENFCPRRLSSRVFRFSVRLCIPRLLRSVLPAKGVCRCLDAILFFIFRRLNIIKEFFFVHISFAIDFFISQSFFRIPNYLSKRSHRNSVFLGKLVKFYIHKIKKEQSFSKLLFIFLRAFRLNSKERLIKPLPTSPMFNRFFNSIIFSPLSIFPFFKGSINYNLTFVKQNENLS